MTDKEIIDSVSKSIIDQFIEANPITNKKKTLDTIFFKEMQKLYVMGGMEKVQKEIRREIYKNKHGFMLFTIREKQNRGTDK